MLEAALLFVLMVVVAFPAAWLTIGAYENIAHPFLNESFTAEVMAMTRMREDYPEFYTHVSYRRLHRPQLRRILFRFIVAWETCAALLLWLGAISLGLAALGLLTPDIALTIAVIGTLAFTMTWMGFLVAGNWFCYWFGHEGGQNTHYQMTLWGLATLMVLLLGAIYLHS